MKAKNRDQVKWIGIKLSEHKINCTVLHFLINAELTKEYWLTAYVQKNLSYFTPLGYPEKYIQKILFH